MSDRVFNVLFLCTGNSARSIMAESILARDGGTRFRAFSAGSMPKPDVNPLALETLIRLDYPTAGMRSKSWDEFEAPDAPAMDFIITVCDNAAGEVCPVWPGHPQSAHWGIEDPAAVQGSPIEQKHAFAIAFQHMKNRIAAFIALPIERLDRMTLSSQLREIGRQDGASAATLEIP